MSSYFITVPEDGYWFGKEGIQKIEYQYNSKYMGYWCIKNSKGEWNEQPVDIFYQPEPDHEKGHTNYFGMFHRNGHVMITDGESAFSVPITGIATDTGEVLVSRYRHDCVMKDGYMIDGGRDYLRLGEKGKIITIKVDGFNFIFEEVKWE